MKTLVSCCVAASFLLAATSLTEATSKDGPRRWTKVLKKKTAIEYKIAFIATQKDAEFSVIGDGGTDVDIYVVDSKGIKVAQDVELTDLAMVRWKVPISQTYTIRVVNLGDADNECVMGHN